MSFTNPAFAALLALAFSGYWALGTRRRRAQNVLLLATSAVFYGWWDARFLALIAISTLVDYYVARRLALTGEPLRRRTLLGVSLTVNLGLLGYFKYAGFFVDSFRAAFGAAYPEGGLDALDLILPVGISFYTFQTLSYTIDVYRGGLPAARSLLDFATFVSFFPQLVAGPIERAGDLLPQLQRERRFDGAAARDGLRQMLWGYVKKLWVADNCGQLADVAFAQVGPDGTGAGAPLLWLGLLAFAMQIYADFSAYSDIAIGTARLFGVQLSQNFATPYFSRTVPEFWRRWHIPLSRWFRDYVYIPLGGSAHGRWRTYGNVVVVFVVSGLWHGAAWTFVGWGATHALLMLPWVVGPRWLARGLSGVPTTFVLIALAWVLFRAPDFATALHYYGGLFDFGGAGAPLPFSPLQVAVPVAGVLLMLGVEATVPRRQHGLASVVAVRPAALRWSVYLVLIYLALTFMRIDSPPFIYFQF